MFLMFVLNALPETVNKRLKRKMNSHYWFTLVFYCRKGRFHLQCFKIFLLCSLLMEIGRIFIFVFFMLMFSCGILSISTRRCPIKRIPV